MAESSFRRPDRDEEFGYESLHILCGIPALQMPEAWEEREDMPEVFEVQLRTLFMHAWAEQQHRLVYKREGDLPHEARKVIAWTAASAWAADRAIASIWEWKRYGHITPPYGEDPNGHSGPPGSRARRASGFSGPVIGDCAPRPDLYAGPMEAMPPSRV